MTDFIIPPATMPLDFSTQHLDHAKFLAMNAEATKPVPNYPQSREASLDGKLGISTVVVSELVLGAGDAMTPQSMAPSPVEPKMAVTTEVSNQVLHKPHEQITSIGRNMTLDQLSQPTPPLTRPTSPAPSPMHQSRPYVQAVMASWEKLTALQEGASVVLNGESLDIPSLVAVAKWGAKAQLDQDEKVINRINESVEVLARHLREGEMVYGVNTGFGGSADVRTNDLRALQKGLVQHQNSAILSSHDIMGVSTLDGAASDIQSKAMPTSWARGLMLSRLNSIIRGHSAVSMPIIEGIITFLDNNITPIIPKRGSISASGDLIPLSYLAGALQGNPDIYVQMKDSEGKCRVVSSDEALRLINMTPIVLGAKEGLGLLNGTAASASVGSLALYEANHIVVLSQILTAMGCEAMKGTAESFHPFIAAARPHRGQVETAANILGFLSGSRLAQSVEETKEVGEEGLAQDRYALRTASQWIGPQVEDLMLANEQVNVELNSTTDNPLIDISSNHVLHGGNFQAASVTSAMEKSRLGLNMVAKLLFAQTTEIINPAMNRGLPPNLCADDPSVSFMGKGIDITMAAYYSEVAYLANPVSTHVQSAEMHNQAVNSLALISARYTLEVNDILSHMCANYLIMVCQALDLRVLQQRFLRAARARAVEMTGELVDRLVGSSSESARISQVVWNSLAKEWDHTTTLDLVERSRKTAETASAALMQALRKCSVMDRSAFEIFDAVESWTGNMSEMISTLYNSTRQEMFEQHTTITPTYLGQGSAELYNFVRKDLQIPFHRGLVDCPTYKLLQGEVASVPAEQRVTIGRQISKVYEAITSGRIHQSIMAAVKTNLL